MENQFWAVCCGLGWTMWKKGLGWLWATFEACFFTFSGSKIIFKKFLKKFFDPEKGKKQASKVAHNRPRPFFPTNQPRPQPTAQNWFPILENLGTRHLFSYLWWRGWCATFTIWAITAHPTSQFIRTGNKSQLGIF